MVNHWLLRGLLDIGVWQDFLNIVLHATWKLGFSINFNYRNREQGTSTDTLGPSKDCEEDDRVNGNELASFVVRSNS